jgi:hypothetical protein
MAPCGECHLKNLIPGYCLFEGSVLDRLLLSKTFFVCRINI